MCSVLVSKKQILLVHNALSNSQMHKAIWSALQKVPYEMVDVSASHAWSGYHMCSTALACVQLCPLRSCIPLLLAMSYFGMQMFACDNYLPMCRPAL